MELSEDEVDEPAEVEEEDEEQGRNILEPQVIVAFVRGKKVLLAKFMGGNEKITFLQDGNNF